MLFTTPEQFVVLAIVLVGGWLIGFASAPSTKKWKRRVREQSESFTAHYTALEERLRAAEHESAEIASERDRLRANNHEAEHTITSLRAAAMAAPVAAVVASETERPALTLVESAPHPVAEHAPTPASEPVADTPVAHEADLVEVPGEKAAPVADAHHAAEAPAEPVAEPEHGEAPVVPEPVSVAAHEPETTHPVEALPVPEEVAAEPVAEHESEAVAADNSAESQAESGLSEHAHPTETTAIVPVIAAAEPIIETAHDPVVASEPVTLAPMTPTPTDAPPAPIGPAEPEMPSKGWFASSARDDLTRIRGISDTLNTQLFSLGVVRFEDLEKLSAEDEMALEQHLALPVGYIAREQWRTQSALLRAGQVDEHAAHFGATEPAPVG